MPDEFSKRARDPVADGKTNSATHQPWTIRAEGMREFEQELGRHEAFLRDLARRYNWWQSEDVALQFPARLIAHVMNLGTFEDISRLWRTLGDDCLRRVLGQAEAGQFNPRSWHYWHYRLHQLQPGQVPPMPERRIA